jgi:hypothetical protein
MSNSFEYIKPCNLCASPGSFEDNLIPMDRILSDLVSIFSEYIWNFG